MPNNNMPDNTDTPKTHDTARTDAPDSSDTPGTETPVDGDRAVASKSDIPSVSFPRKSAPKLVGVKWAGTAIAIVASVLILLQNINIFPAAGTPDPIEAGPQSSIISPTLGDPVLMSAKMMLGVFEMPGFDEDLRQTVNKMLFAPKVVKDYSVIDMLRLSVFKGVAIDAASGTLMLDEVDARIVDRQSRIDTIAQDKGVDRADIQAMLDELASDATLVRTVFAEGVDEADSFEMEHFIARHGWFGELLETHGTEKGKHQRQLMAAQGVKAFLIVFALMVIVGCAFMVGLVLLVVTWFQNFQGRLHWRFRHAKGSVYVYAETFALFLAAFLTIIVLSNFASVGASDRTLLIVSIMRTLAQFSLVGLCFYPFFRGARPELVTRDIGWHTGKGLTSEIFAGVLGYFAGLPVIAMGMGVMLFFMWIVGLLTGGSGESPTHPIVESYTGSGFAIITTYVFAVLWAPFVEETMFRGYFFAFLRHKHAPIFSGIVSAFVFAAIHPQGWMFIPALGSIGYVFAMLREWRGSLVAPMVAHALHNATLVTFGVLLFRTLM